ncbi:hypothetical protein Lal_00040856 [Lupinus albus]|uniref:Putative Zinc finger, C3HC n=1 Tax=Lupinus albus TaxID=3870 RepID=A0A6A4PKM2_LUPAL|nr:putative Zinc finger, C3HC [Lupinus albus]KAF1887256.1 hypothetical protein Lal_00040856 [Lupinus albus]
MANDSEKRFHSIMDKLFHPPPLNSQSTSSPSRKRSYQSMELMNRRGDVSEGELCRPWDRGDFMKRLATFKSMSWFAKPKVVSAVNCARRGWINVDIDTIACEACGARLLFATPASWNHQQVEKAALVFSLKLDSGHKLLCPWVDNACDEKLARFPPTAPPVLVDNFNERHSALLQLSALPRISASAIECVQSPLLQDFLREPLMLELGNSETEFVSSQEELKLYYQAQKLISLCGWTLRSLPYVVDCKDISDHSVKDTTILNDSRVDANMNNNSLIAHSADNDESSKDSNGKQLDPNSAVLDCTICGATVGLWAFCKVPRPVESIRLVGYAEVNSENDHENRQDVNSSTTDVETSSKVVPSSLNMTIAGGPPPTKQNFKAIISLPVIGQNLRARFSYDSGFRGHDFIDGGDIQLDSQKKMRIQEKSDNTVNACSGQLVLVSSEIREISGYETGSIASIHDSVVDDVIEGTSYAGQPSGLKDTAAVHLELQKDRREVEALSISQKTLDGEGSSRENHGVKDRVENPSKHEDVYCSFGRDVRVTVDKAMEFDPIKQHRHFCPWISSIDDGEPGWKQTLSALYHQKNHLPHSPNRSSSKPIVKVDDPVGSVRKIFMSPSARRMKLARTSAQNTEHSPPKISSPKVL